MTDPFQEVHEELRKQKLDQFWKTYRVYILGGAAAIVAVVCVIQGWNYYNSSRQQAASVAFNEATKLFRSQGAEKEAALAFEMVADNAPSGYRLMARLQEAAARAVSGDEKGALAIYDSLATDGTGGDLFADYARVRAALLVADRETLAQMTKRLDLVANGQGAWRHLARELLAYSAWRAGDIAQAQKRFDLIVTDTSASDGVRARARSMNELITSGKRLADIQPLTPPEPPAAPAAAPVLPPDPAAPAQPAPGAPAPASPPQGQ